MMEIGSSLRSALQKSYPTSAKLTQISPFIRPKDFAPYAR